MLLTHIRINYYGTIVLLQLRRCQQTIEQLRMEKEQAAQQCHDLQQELAMEGEHHQEMSEEVKRLKKELNSRFSNMTIVKKAFEGCSDATT